MRAAPLIALPLALLLLGSCETAQVKEAGDKSAETLQDAPCLIGLGPWSRMDDRRKRIGAFYLCVPDAEDFGVRLETP
jgi:hypothetical protein